MDANLGNLGSAFGDVLRDLRLRSQLSQAELSLDSGISKPFISALERGTRRPALDTVFQLSAALNVDPDELVRMTQMHMHSGRSSRGRARRRR